MIRINIAAILAATRLAYTSAYDNGLGATPPMGWSTWCTNDICGLRDKCSAYEVKKRADALVDQGMDEYGYKWLLLDDCWAAHSRDENDNLQPDPKRFPLGMQDLVDYVHSKGLYIGLYTCVGTETCKKNRPGSYGHYEQDAAQFAAWGVDMVKADNCHHPDSGETTEELYTQLSQALNATGHPMLFAMCEWGRDEVWNWGPGISQMYRISMDHLPLFHWPATAQGEGYGCGTAEIIDWMADLHPSQYVAPFQWMDPDFLETLFPVSMNYTHSRTEFTFWAFWSAPLLVSTEVIDLSEEKRAILLNEEVLAVHGDPLFVAGERIYRRDDGTQAWYRPLQQEGAFSVVLYNANNFTTLPVNITWEQLGIQDVQQSMQVRDLWERLDVGAFKNSYEATVKPNDIQMITLVPSTAATAAEGNGAYV